jgi:hypothetical protein
MEWRETFVGIHAWPGIQPLIKQVVVLVHTLVVVLAMHAIDSICKGAEKNVLIREVQKHHCHFKQQAWTRHGGNVFKITGHDCGQLCDETWINGGKTAMAALTFLAAFASTILALKTLIDSPFNCRPAKCRMVACAQ